MAQTREQKRAKKLKLKQGRQNNRDAQGKPRKVNNTPKRLRAEESVLTPAVPVASKGGKKNG